MSQDTTPRFAWSHVATQVISGVQCEVLHRRTHSNVEYQWINVDTGAVVQQVRVPHRRRRVRYGGAACGLRIIENGKHICLRDFVRCVPHFARGFTFDREYRLNVKEALLYDSEQLTALHQSTVTIARLIIA